MSQEPRAESKTKTRRPAVGRRSSFTSDVSRRRRLNTLRFDGLKEFQMQKSLLANGLDSSSVKDVLTIFEDHRLWKKGCAEFSFSERWLER